VPKLKIDDDDLDIDALEAAEYNEDDFVPYTGPEPKAGTFLTGYVRKAWWGYNRNEDSMITLVWEAADNKGKMAVYNGLSIWEHLSLTANVKFRWKPWMDAMGLTLKDVKTKMYVEPEDDNVGAPIEKIGTWKPGEENDAAWCRIMTSREKYQGEWQTRAGRWLPYEEQEDDEDEVEADDEVEEEEAEVEVEEDEAEDEEPEEEEDEEEEPEEEPEEAPAPPPRAGRRAAAKAPARPAPTRAAAASTKPATGRTKPAAATPAPAAKGRRAAAPAPKNAADAPARRGRRAATAGSDDPPF
jgi:hypothetical protein